MNLRALTGLSRLTFFLLLSALGVRAGEAGRALYLGDSLSYGAFGRTLDTDLRKAGLALYTQVTGGATPYYWLADFESVKADVGHWVKTPDSEKRTRTLRAVPKVETLLKKWKPEVVIVQTGTNLYAELRSKRKTPEERVRTVEYLIERMGKVVTDAGSRIYWISPPDSHVERYPRELQEQMREIIKRVGGKYGRVFDSYAVTRYTDPYPANDGIHYGDEEAIVWAHGVERDMLPWISTRPPSPALAMEEKATSTAVGLPAAPEIETIPLVPVGNAGELGESGAEAEQPAEEEDSADEAPPEAVRRADESGGPPESPAQTVEEPITVRRAVPVQSAANILKVKAVLVEKTEFREPRRISYRNALAIYEYRIEKVLQGHGPGERLRVAHLVMENRKMRQEKDWPTGRTVTLTLVPLSTYPDVEKLETLDELPDEPDLPVYTPKQ